MGSRWVTVSDSPHDHEREALVWLRSRLPDRTAYHVWANFEFTTQNGQIYEVDALAITDNGVHLIEIKGYPGRIDGDANTWQWTSPDGKFRQFDNPRVLANRKAKALKSLLLNTRAFSRHRNELPFVTESVFLSDPKLVSGLNPQGRFGVFGRDGANRDDPLPPERAALGGILDHLMSLEPDEQGRSRRRLNPRVVERLVTAMGEIGIRERSSRREVGDFQLGDLLQDVEADVTTGVAYQDFEAKHRNLDLTRRLRIYPLELNATAEQREAASRAGRREFELLHRLDHPGIIKPVGFTEHERGPVLFFDYDPDEVTLEAYLADPANANLTVDARLGLLRQIAEALAYANSHGIFHRSLSPSAVLVRHELDTEAPRVRITNWHTGVRIAEGSTGTIATGTRHTHVEALASSGAELYRAPEFGQPEARPALLDVFSLGALALFILTGEQPASSARQLRQSLAAVGYLDPAAITDAIDEDLAGLVQIATAKLPSQRPGTPAEFIGYLDAVEEHWDLHERDAEVDELPPTEVRRGDRLLDGRFEVVQRLGRGSTAIALLVVDHERAGQLCVLKFAEDPEHNDRILDEAATLEGLQHESIVMLLDGPIEIAGHAAIVVSYAGPKIDRPRADEPPTTPSDDEEPARGRTLASRLATGPVGAELAQRWGEDLLSALRYLEGVGRAHRDIKPDNLGVAPRGDREELHLVLFDFSLSSVPLDRIESGTPGYLDPFLGDTKRPRLDPAADRYAATVTLFQLTTGDKPRYGDGTAHPAMSGEPPRVDASMFDAAAATGLVEFFTKALQSDAEDRFGSADEMFWAWHAAFEAAARRATESHHPEADDEFIIPDSATLDTPLAGLPLTRRAVSALERVDVTTVRQLLSYSVMKLRSIPGVGAMTRGEVREATDLLRTHFADALATETSPPEPDTTEPEPTDTQPLGESWLEQTAFLAAPAARTSALKTRAELSRILAGLAPDRDPWASQTELADWLGVTRARISQLTGDLTKAWLKHSEITRVREQVRAGLDTLQVASADQLAARLVRNTPDGKVPERAHEIAVGLVRVATLTEAAIASPGWIMRRRQGASLLAVQPDADTGPAHAQALADYAAALATETTELIQAHAILARGELLDRLHQIRRPANTAPLSDAHLADLAADLCDDAAVNARLELYRVGLEPLSALAAVRRAFVAAERFTPDEIAAKVEARFPAAAPLPARPELDDLLTEAGVDLVWRDDAYINPQHEASPSTSYSTSVSRYPTGVGQTFPQEVIDIAADFERRLTDARTGGSLLVLVTDPKELDKAATQVARLADATFNIDDLIARELDTIAAVGKPSWETLAAVDAAGPSGPRWGSLERVLTDVLNRVTETITSTPGAVLVTNPGLLARYDRLDLIAAWRDALHGSDTSMTALWLLAPASTATDVPMLDGRAIPVISRNEWSRLPTEWLRNAHRANTPT